MDADLQDPPELLGRARRRLARGPRGRLRRAPRGARRAAQARAPTRSSTARCSVVADIDVPLDAGDFCLLDRRVVDALVALPEHNRFLRGLRSWVGFRQTGVEYERDARYAGEPKYTLRKLVRLALSGYVGFSAMPLRLAAWLGLLAAAAGFAVALLGASTRGCSTSRARAAGRPPIAVMLFVGGVQLLMLGVIGEYLGRVYDEVRRGRSTSCARGSGLVGNHG